jgi:hypothetical protein
MNGKNSSDSNASTRWASAVTVAHYVSLAGGVIGVYQLLQGHFDLDLLGLVLAVATVTSLSVLLLNEAAKASRAIRHSVA